MNNTVRTKKVVIVGAGPAGMFAAFEFLKKGIDDVIILDMGKPIEERKCPNSRKCNCKVCDILEGEGGAGGFSDGKKTYSLTRGTQMEDIFDPAYEPYLKEIDDIIVNFGIEGVWSTPLDKVPDNFKNSPFEFGSYPLRHIGSDGVRTFIDNFGKYLREHGVEMQFSAEVEDIITDSETGAVCGVTVKEQDGDVWVVEAEYVLIATGLQGIPWLEYQMKSLGIKQTAGPAGIGLRVEADYKVLAPLFDEFYDFKLVYQYKNMTFRSFCCNQRGFITNENHRTLGVRNVNGHSYVAENMKSDSSNFAIICKIGLDADDNPQGLVRTIARHINDACDGMTAVQFAKDFVRGESSSIACIDESNTLTDTQAIAGVNIGGLMPNDVYQGFAHFLIDLNEYVPGLLDGDTLIYAPEVKYFGKKCPVDFKTWKCTAMDGLYILGNASGYLDSFVSAALTGVIAADGISTKIKSNEGE